MLNALYVASCAASDSDYSSLTVGVFSIGENNMLQENVLSLNIFLICIMPTYSLLQS